jgi:alkanesulfonate monooxygenase SsuD/methylene tetrahydromethanopterin reductase-like flavin-dependent oxidoreductase (luciferase family)
MVVATQTPTIDHVSHGRFALNVVCGWYEPEFLMFGAGDWDAVANLAGSGRRQAGPPGPGERLRPPGWGSTLLVGTPEQIVDQLMHLTAMGLDGVGLSWVNDEAELAYGISDVLPVMEPAGLRRSYAPAHTR